jgi:hypothetical protein
VCAGAHHVEKVEMDLLGRHDAGCHSCSVGKGDKEYNECSQTGRFPKLLNTTPAWAVDGRCRTMMSDTDAGQAALQYCI